MARRKRNGQIPTPTDVTRSRQPIFSDAGSNIVPGEILVQLHEDVAGRIDTNIHTGPSRGMVGGASTFGVSEVDQVLADLDVTSINRLHPPVSFASAAVETAINVASTFRIRYQGKMSVQDAVQKLNGLNEITYAEANVYRETSIVPNDPSYATQWGLAKINCPAAWDRTTGSPNVVVAVIDTGVDLNHPELAPLLVPGFDTVDLGPNPVPPNGFRFEGDFTGRDNDPQDEVGHGTHVAGTIACLSNNGAGVAGVTWNCRLMPVRVLARIVNRANPRDVRGTGSAADIAAGIRWAVDHGARVLNLSLGGPVDTQVERDAIAYAISRGAVVVAAMGNAGNNLPSFPAAYPDVVAVGAINSAERRANFSNFGPHIDVAAPGVGVLSTVWDNGFATFDGTSMASPHVAGVAALILSCNGNLTGPQVADIIRQTARPLRDNPADPVPNDRYGFGLVDAKAALDRACPPQKSRPIIQCQSIPVSRCPTILTNCVSRPVVTCPSVVTRCPTETPLCVEFSRPVVCRTRTFVECGGPSVPIQTCPRPSLPVRCPSGPVCGIDQPLPFGFSAFDPYGFGADNWEAFDPYSPWYGDDPNGGENK